MCGIGGFIGKVALSFKEEILKDLAATLVERGNHANGVGYYQGNKEVVVKAPVDPTKVDFKTLFDYFGDPTTPAIIFHNRFATKGAVKENKNNHPFKGDGFLLAHNGVIGNEEELIEKYQLKVLPSEPETDSFTLVRILNKLLADGKGMVEALQEMLPNVVGSLVLEILTKDKVYLVKGDKYSYRLIKIGNNYIWASKANSGAKEEHIKALTSIIGKITSTALFEGKEKKIEIKEIEVPQTSIISIDLKTFALKIDTFEKQKQPKNSFAKSKMDYRYYGNNSLFYKGSESERFEGCSSYKIPNFTPKRKKRDKMDIYDDAIQEVYERICEYRAQYDGIFELLESDWDSRILTSLNNI